MNDIEPTLKKIKYYNLYLCWKAKKEEAEFYLLSQVFAVNDSAGLYEKPASFCMYQSQMAKSVRFNMSLRPFVYWAQTETDIFLKVDVKKVEGEPDVCIGNAKLIY